MCEASGIQIRVKNVKKLIGLNNMLKMKIIIALENM